MTHLVNVEEQVRGMVGSIAGEGVAVGVYAVHFGTGREIAVNPDTRFPTASTVKVPILFALYRKVAAGALDLGTRVTLEARHRTAGSGVLQDLDLGLQPTLHDLATLMITVSDNQATDMVYEAVGGDYIQQVAHEIGMANTFTPRTVRALLHNLVGMDETPGEDTYALNRDRLRTTTPNLDGWALSVGDDNDVSTPRDMVALLTRIHAGQDPNPPSCTAMVDILKRQKFNTIIPLLLPPEIETAHKTGSIHGVRNDVGIVYAPASHGGPYAVAIMSRHLADPVAGARTLADVSRAVWDAFTA